MLTRVETTMQAKTDPQIGVDWFDLALLSALNNHIESIKKQYAYHGLSPLNDYPAPPDPDLVAKVSLLRNFYHAANLLHPESPKLNPELGTASLLKTIEAAKHQDPESIQNKLGDFYLTWLSLCILSLPHFNNQQQYTDTLHLIQRHLNITEELALTHRSNIDNLLLPLLLQAKNNPR